MGPLEPNRFCYLVPAAAATATATASTLSSGAVFIGGTMGCGAGMPLPIPGLVPLEVGERLGPARRRRPTVAVSRIVAVIHVAVEPAPAVEPRPGSDKQSAVEPVRPIVPIGRAVTPPPREA